MTYILDRPVWSALKTAHAGFAEGTPLALRYPATIAPFAAAMNGAAESLEALSDLSEFTDSMLLLEACPIAIPDSLEIVAELALVQMLAMAPHVPVSDERIVALTEADGAQMLELGRLAGSCPFAPCTRGLGAFWGLKRCGRLIGMAGQRLRQPGFVEISDLCIHPDFRGRGLGTLLLRFLTGRIISMGATAYLHAPATDRSCMPFYNRLGFERRAEMTLRLVRRRASRCPAWIKARPMGALHLSEYHAHVHPSMHQA